MKLQDNIAPVPSGQLKIVIDNVSSVPTETVEKFIEILNNVLKSRGVLPKYLLQSDLRTLASAVVELSERIHEQREIEVRGNGDMRVVENDPADVLVKKHSAAITLAQGILEGGE